MQEILIYKEDKLLLTLLAIDYEIDAHTNTYKFVYKIDEIEITYSVPLNKGYKIIAEI